jgi:hypothetical protein
LLKHKRFLKNLVDAKTKEKEEQEREEQEKENKIKKFKEIAGN